jgi:hypothetical protein
MAHSLYAFLGVHDPLTNAHPRLHQGIYHNLARSGILYCAHIVHLNRSEPIAQASPGAAVEHCYAAKSAKYSCRGDASYTCVPMSIETCCRCGARVMDLIRRVKAAECSDFAFCSAQFVSGIFRELSVGLSKWIQQLDCAVAGFLARTSGCRF